MKNYVKPGISFQFFNLATNASGGCSLESNQAAYSCAVGIPDNPGITVFTATNCDFEVDNPEDFGICYGVPVSDARVLGS